MENLYWPIDVRCEPLVIVSLCDQLFNWMQKLHSVLIQDFGLILFCPQLFLCSSARSTLSNVFVSCMDSFMFRFVLRFSNMKVIAINGDLLTRKSNCTLDMSPLI